MVLVCWLRKSGIFIGNQKSSNGVKGLIDAMNKKLLDLNSLDNILKMAFNLGVKEFFFGRPEGLEPRQHRYERCVLTN